MEKRRIGDEFACGLRSLSYKWKVQVERRSGSFRKSAFQILQPIRARTRREPRLRRQDWWGGRPGFLGLRQKRERKESREQGCSPSIGPIGVWRTSPVLKKVTADDVGRLWKKKGSALIDISIKELAIKGGPSKQDTTHYTICAAIFSHLPTPSS